MPQAMTPIPVTPTQQPDKVLDSDWTQILQVISDLANSIQLREPFPTIVAKLVGAIPVFSKYVVLLPLIAQLVSLLADLTVIVKNVHDLADTTQSQQLDELRCICDQLACMVEQQRQSAVKLEWGLQLITDFNTSLSFSTGNIASAILVAGEQNKLEDRLVFDPANPDALPAFNQAQTPTVNDPHFQRVNCGS